MASSKEVAQGSEWRVMVPCGTSVKLEMESGSIYQEWLWLYHLVSAAKLKVSGFMKRAWKIGADDPRTVVHCIKVGIALTLVSVFYYTRPLYDGVGGTAMWAIMTIVVVFEYTVGMCIKNSQVARIVKMSILAFLYLSRSSSPLISVGSTS